MGSILHGLVVWGKTEVSVQIFTLSFLFLLLVLLVSASLRRTEVG